VNLNLYYTYDEPDLAVMREAFEEASRLLFNSTDGQMYFNSVRVSKNEAFKAKADIWVNDGAGGAFAYVGKLGQPGFQITLFKETHRWTNEDGPLKKERGQFGIVHEFGHYGFNLYDEYNVQGKYPGAACVSSTSDVACIMDGGTTVHPEHHRTEWCTPAGGGLATSHVVNPLTPQQEIHGESCWETIVKYCQDEYGITLAIPAAVNTADPPGLPPLGWVVIGDHLRFAVALDRSGSMAVDQKMELAKTAASLFVDLCNDDEGESLAVVSFSDEAESAFPMKYVQTYTTPGTKDQAITAIEGITLGNMTALGDGLRQAFNEITGFGSVSPDDSVTEAVLLLSDGVHNYGEETPGDVLPDLRARGVRVFTIGLGDPGHPQHPLDEDTLLEIANETGGLYTHVVDPEELPAVFAGYAAEVRGMGTYPEMTGEAQAGSSEKHTVFVDEFTREQTFVLHWRGAPDALTLKLRSPDGSMITADSLKGAEYVARKNYALFRISDPLPGNWQVLVERKEAASGEQRVSYTIQAFTRDPGLSFAVAADRVAYLPGEAPIINASVAANGVPVTGAEVKGRVICPDGETMTIVLYDDGDWQAHGDYKANDGLYSARFAGTKALGTYRVELTVNNKEGVTAQPDELGVAWKPTPVSPFVRAAEYTFAVGRKEEASRQGVSSDLIKFTIGQKGYRVGNLFFETDVAPFIVGERSFVPVRFLADSLGAETEWDGRTRTVTITRRGTEISLRVGDRTMLVNGEPGRMDVSPVIRHDRVFLPARWVVEALGGNVHWDASERAVTMRPDRGTATAPTKPANLTASVVSRGVMLSWDASVDDHEVAGYAVYRSEDPASRFVRIGSCEDTTYIDYDVDPGKVYYYQVRAYDAEGNLSLPSDWVSESNPRPSP